MSPIVHSGVALLGWQKCADNKNFKTLLIFLLISNLPDIDFLFILLIGKKAITTHQYYTHNVFFVCIAVMFFFPLLKSKLERIGFLLVAFSHLLLDLITIDGVTPFGFRLFYPLSNQLFHFGFFPNLHKKNLADIFTLHNLWVLVIEALIFFVPVMVYYRKEFASHIKEKEFRKLKCKS